MQTERQTGTDGYKYSREVDKPAGRQADTSKELGRRTGVTGAHSQADMYMRVHVQQRGRQTGRQTGRYVGGVRQIVEADKPAGRQADMWKALGRRTGVTSAGREADRYRQVHVQAGRRSRAGRQADMRKA